MFLTVSKSTNSCQQLTSKQNKLTDRFTKAQGLTDSPVELRRGVFPMQINLLRRHPVDVKFREIHGVMYLKAVLNLLMVI